MKLETEPARQFLFLRGGIGVVMIWLRTASGMMFPATTTHLHLQEGTGEHLAPG